MEKEEFCFVIIMLEAIKWHPAVNIGYTCLESLQSLLLGFGAGGVDEGEVQLGIICVEMIPSVVGTDDINGQGVYREEDGVKDGALGDAAGQRVKGGFLPRYCNTLSPIREIGPQPINDGSRQAKMRVETVE